jgi:Bacterial Ig domain
MSHMASVVARLRLAAASAAALTLIATSASCGGGFFLAIGFGVDTSSPPTGSLSAPSSAQRGQTIRLSAAASDDFGIDQVAFFRDEGVDTVLLGADGDSPYEQLTQIPLNAVGTVTYFATATDVDGNKTESASVSVIVAPTP